MKRICNTVVKVALAAVASAWTAAAGAVIVTPIDLNDFTADPTVVVAADGSSASFTEDFPFFVVSLVNLPSAGSPFVIVPAAGRDLAFDFVFTEAAGNDDEFFAAVLDNSTGFSVSPAFEFSTTSSSSGTVTFALGSLAGQTLGLAFDLVSFELAETVGSTLVISNVRLLDPDPGVVPEPAVLLLLAAGLVGAGVARRR